MHTPDQWWLLFPLSPAAAAGPHLPVSAAESEMVATPPGVVTGLAIKWTCLWRKRAMEENGLFLCKTNSWGYKLVQQLDSFLGLYLRATFARACCCLPSVRASFGEALCLLQSWLNRCLSAQRAVPHSSLLMCQSRWHGYNPLRQNMPSHVFCIIVFWIIVTPLASLGLLCIDTSVAWKLSPPPLPFPVAGWLITGFELEINCD